MGSRAILNNQLLNLNRMILDYYNTFISDISDINTGTPYFFSEMKDIGKNSRAGMAPSEGTKTARSNELSIFIDSLLNFRISNDITDVSNLIKVKSSNVSADLDMYVINNIHRMLNIVNVFIDCLEALIWYMTDNQAEFKVKIAEITNIQIVNSKSRPQSKASYDNYGYIHENTGSNTLVLSIKSFDIENPTSANTLNPVLSAIGSMDVKKYLFDTNNIIDVDLYNNLQSLRKQTATLSAGKVYMNGSSTPYVYNVNNIDETSFVNVMNRRDQAIFSNFLYFLMIMDKDNCRMQVNALYFYYKFIRNYILLISSTVNLSMYNLLASADYKNINIVKLNTGSADFTASNLYDSSEFINIVRNMQTHTVVTLSVKSMINVYEFVRSKIAEDLENSIAFLYETNISRDMISKLTNIDFEMEISQHPNLPDVLALNFSADSSAASIRNVLSNGDNVDTFRKRYVIVYRGKPYDIYGVNVTNTSRFIYIYGKLHDNSSSELEHLPSIYAPVNSGADKRMLRGIKIMNKGLLSLKIEYNSRKRELSNINTDIRYHTTKINNQKNLYNFHNGKNTMLVNQFYIYGVIIGFIAAGFLLMQITGSDKGTQQMLSFAFTGIILLLIIIYYIINVSYMEEFQNFSYNQGDKVVEGFAFQKVNDLSNKQNEGPNYIADKMNLLSNNIELVNSKYLEYFQKIKAILPMTETQDFYVELNDVMMIESGQKKTISNKLSYKRSLGYSNIDLVKYENHNYKVYISTMLISFLIFSLLYVLSLFLPDDYKSLIIFVGLIFGIIIFSYFFIFTHTYVRTKPDLKYWGPTFNDKF